MQNIEKIAKIPKMLFQIKINVWHRVVFVLNLCFAQTYFKIRDIFL